MRAIAPITLLVLALAATACGAAPIKVTGTLTMKRHYPSIVISEGLCVTSGGYADIRPGAQVVITDAASKTLAVGQLDLGKPNEAEDCVWPFAIDGVPGGLDFYGVEVNRRGRVQYPAVRISQPLTLTLGD